MRLTDDEKRAYDAARGLPRGVIRAACHAPFLTMAFHPTGQVLACCRKPAVVLGDIRTQRLDEIWNGATRKRLVAAMKRFEFPPGCDVCGNYVRQGDYATADCVRTYDNEPVRAPEPVWPTRLEFSLANTCTLQCVACSGALSSAIRKHREHLAPLPRVYGDVFFEDLRRYLHHVHTCVFLGGEPFSQQECFRVWDLMLEEGVRPRSYVNTNGMVLNERVERLVEALPMDLAISFDGCTAATVESLRVGASFERMQANARRFGELIGGGRGQLYFNFCPMRSNWQEFPGFLEMAEDFGARAYVNTMASPEELSLYHLPRAQLLEVVAGLEAHDGRLAARLKRNGSTWTEFLRMLRGKLEPRFVPGLQLAFDRSEERWTSATEPERAERTRAAEELVERGHRVLVDPPWTGVQALRHGWGVYPFYGRRAAGSRFWDAAGNEYIDWYMGGGTMTLGHAHPDVVEALREQLELGANLSLPSALEVEVAERLCALVPGAEMVVFGKNGTDVVGAAVRLARIVTGREHVLKCGYHGFQDWSWAAEPGSPGIPAALRAIVHAFRFNDLRAAQELMDRHGRETAAIVVEPVQFAAPQREFLAGLRELADRHGCLLVFDEIVTGFRVARGGIQEALGIFPDLTCLSKSLANGLPLSALVGPRRLMRRFMGTEFGMTYRRDALAVAAARATLEVYRRQDVSAHLADIGTRIQSAFADAAGKAGVECALVGHPAMLHMSFRAGGRLERRGVEDLFVQSCQRNGVFVYLHRVLPSLAHTPEDVQATAEVFADALCTVRRAMDVGLEGHLDGPIWDELQSPLLEPLQGLAIREASEPAPFELGAAPAHVRGGGLRLVRRPADGPCSIERVGHGFALQAAAPSHTQPGTCRVEVSERVEGAFRARARYRVEELPRSDGLVRIQLCARDLRGNRLALGHDIRFGQFAWSRAKLRGKHLESCCPYGVREGVLHVDHDGGLFTVRHETEWVDELGALRGLLVGPLQLSFELHAGTVEGAARVVLTELSIEPVQAVPDAGGAAKPSLLRRLWRRRG